MFQGMFLHSLQCSIDFTSVERLLVTTAVILFLYKRNSLIKL